MHDISPGNGEGLDGRPGDPDPHGVFWLVRVPDDDVFVRNDFAPKAHRIEELVRVPEDDIVVRPNQVTIKVHDLPEVDRFQFLGPGNVPAHLSLQFTYSSKGRPRVIVPQTNDPLSPFNWAGTVWDATAKGSFSFRYDDGSYSAQGTTDSTLPTHELEQYGTMGRERNGFFARTPW